MQNISLQKKVFALLQNCSKGVQTAYQSELLANYIKKHFVKPLNSQIDQSTIKQFTQNVDLHEWPSQTQIYRQNDRITRFYFLLEGNVNIIRGSNGNNSQEGQFITNVATPTVIGEYFIHMLSSSSQNCTRSYSAFTTFPSKGFSVSCEFFNTIFSFLSHQYSQLQTQIGWEFLNAADQLQFCKFELYNFSDVQKYTLNCKIPTQKKNIYIILEGQCVLYSCERTELSTLPQMSPQNKVAKTPVFKLCKHDVINLPQYFERRVSASPYSSPSSLQTSFQYLVVSSQITLLSIPFSSISEFPPELELKLSRLFISHSRQIQEHRKSPNTLKYRNILSTIKQKQALIVQNAKIQKVRGIIGSDTLFTIRKHYCLGLKDGEPQSTASIKRKVITEMPTGYFKQKKKQKKTVKIQIPQRQWISYVKLPKIANMGQNNQHLIKNIRL